MKLKCQSHMPGPAQHIPSDNTTPQQKFTSSLSKLNREHSHSWLAWSHKGSYKLQADRD